MLMPNISRLLIVFMYLATWSQSLFADDKDNELVLGTYTASIAQLSKLKPELLGPKAPKIGVVVFGKSPGCDLDFQPGDVITHINRQVIKTNDDLGKALQPLSLEKKHKLTYQRIVNGKWQKGDVDFKPKPYAEMVKANLNQEFDKVAEVSTLRDKRSPESPDATNIQCWIRNAQTKDSIVLRVSYEGDDWIFFKECIVKVDDETFRLKFDDMKRDNAGRRLWEWSTRLATPEDMKLLKSIEPSKNVTIRFVGDDYKHDYEVSTDELLAIKNILEAYRIRDEH